MQENQFDWVDFYKEKNFLKYKKDIYIMQYN